MMVILQISVLFPSFCNGDVSLSLENNCFLRLGTATQMNESSSTIPESFWEDTVRQYPQFRSLLVLKGGSFLIADDAVMLGGFIKY